MIKKNHFIDDTYEHIYIYIYIYTQVSLEILSQYLLMIVTIKQLRVLVPNLGWRTILDSGMLSSPDALQMLLGWYVFRARITRSKSTLLCSIDLTWSWTFLWPEQNYFNRILQSYYKLTSPVALEMFFDCLHGLTYQFELVMHKVTLCCK